MKRIEQLARLLALAALAWLGWSALHPVVGATSAQARVEDAARLTTQWMRDAELSSLHVSVDGTPPRADLDLLGALRHAGTTVTWSGEMPVLAASAEPVPEPLGETRVTVAALAGSRVQVTDDIGPLDSVRVSGAGAELLASDVAMPLHVALGRWVGSVSQRDSLLLRPLLVLGAAGWEAKFTIAALEERGWRVVTRLAVAPTSKVDQGSILPIDTARYSAVVVLDSTAAPLAGAIARYVRSGGGLVLAGGAARIPALGSIAPATLGEHRATRPALVADSVTPRSLARWTLASLRVSATPLARYGSELALAARVVGAGRVVQTGSEESWRWRLEGADGGARSHREYWSRLVSSVAYAPLVARERAERDMSAPRVRIVDALGSPGSPARASSAFDPLGSPAVLALVLGLLLLEWGSRRLRGAR